ncbi:hypothetical protein [Flavivirga algicola]|uniref:Uncharacterized protein n=1 Tax=Flavivirga algicola TaxID=2729136 RepID=A0ABX1S4K4_9FLAO|nr:hypothetical protein [Flavivirga algicola]NMH89968.1 hypothetical protein [Flavivirga algicola]
MEKSKVVKQIEGTLLRVISYKDKPDVVFCVFDTSPSGLEEERLIYDSYLNIYGCTIRDGYNFDAAYKEVIEHDDFDYVTSVLRYSVRSTFEIKISSLYSDKKSEDDPLIKTLNEIANNNKKAFNQIKKLYYHHVAEIDCFKIIDKPA